MLKAKVQDIEDVAEPLREFYAPDDSGGFKLAVDGMVGVNEVSGLKSALEKEKEKRRLYGEKLQALGGVDPDEYKKLKEDADLRAIKDAEKKGEWDKLRTQLVAQHEKEMKEQKLGNDAMRGSLDRFLIEAEATREIAANHGTPELLLPIVKQRVRVIAENGSFVARVLDEHGDPMISDAKGTPMTIGQLVQSLKESEVYGRAFSPTGKQGVGTPANAQRVTSPLRGVDPSKMSSHDKIKAALDNQQ